MYICIIFYNGVPRRVSRKIEKLSSNRYEQKIFENCEPNRAEPHTGAQSGVPGGLVGMEIGRGM